MRCLHINLNKGERIVQSKQKTTMIKLPHMVILISLSLNVSVSALTEPCFTRLEISEWKRSVAYTETYGICDTFLYEGWYRITSGAGELMPTECPKFGFRCGTANPFYLSREGIIDQNEQTYPKDGETVHRVACLANIGGVCCKERINIKIKNCGIYFVYYLKPTKHCPSAYCFGENLPCPEGESSENGFSPGCGTYPNVTVPTPLVNTGLHQETLISEEDNALYMHYTVKFQCHTKIETNYTYDVRWYIDDLEITEAAHIDVPGENLSFFTMLRQHHWEQIFKPNMMVKCSIQVRDAFLTAPGPRSYSQNFFAGIKVVKNNFRIKEGDQNATVTVPISLTIPIGCSHEVIDNKTVIDMIKDAMCVLNILSGVPTYQNDPDKYCKGELSDEALVFETQQCGIYFKHTNWQTPQHVFVTGASDNKVNVKERLAVLQLYQDADKGSTNIKELNIWNGIMLPEIKFEVVDSDNVTLGSTCQSNNDPHMVTFDGKTYELQKRAGEYVMYQHKQLPIRIHSSYQRCNEQRALCNCGAAVRSGDSLFVANFCGKNRYVKHFICDENDITVQEKNNGYFVTVPSGTRLDITMGQVYHFYGINHFHLKGSSLDYGLTLGICGTYNKNTSDDFTLKGNDQHFDATVFAESWRIQENADSLFNAKELPPLEFNAREYCTCKKTSKSFPYGQPEYACNLTTAMQPCRQEFQTSVYNGRCRRVTHEKREGSLELIDDEEPEHIEISLEDSEIGNPDMSWKNDWTMEKALHHCKNAFFSTTSFSVCTDNVPTVSSDNFINDCVLDIQITGDTQWVDVSTDNYASACLSEALKMEDLTQTNATQDGGTDSIFDLIASSTCPKNCSGYGICNNGQCNCTYGFFGSDCSLEKSQSPVVAPDSFNGVCDTSLRSCQIYIVPGINFLKGNLFCRFRPFKIILNETVDSGITEEIPGKYFGPFYMLCPAPASRQKRSTADENSALGYRLSVSNDGKNFTEELTILIYNTQCLYCNITSLDCIELDTCPISIVPEVVKKSDDQTVLIAGLLGGCATLCLLLALAVVVITKTRSNRIKKDKYKVKKTDKPKILKGCSSDC